MRTLINTYKLKRFNLLEYSGHQWKVDGKNSTGLRRRIRFKAISLEDAIAKANQFLNPQSSQEDVTIAQALIRSKQDRKWSEYQQMHDNAWCRYFLDWCDSEKIRYWSQLNYEHMQKYKKFLENRSLAYNTIRLYFQPVRRAAA